MTIASPTNERIKALSRLLTPRGRKEDGRFLVEGHHLVDEAWKAGLLIETFALPGVSSPEGIPLTVITPPVLRKLCETQDPEGIVGLARAKEKGSLKGERWLILDGLQDPGNVGTLIRSALAFEASTVVLSYGVPDPFSGKVLRASQGAVFHQNIVMMSSLDAARAALRDGFRLIGAEAHGNGEAKDLAGFARIALVLGSEAHGLSQEVESLLTDRWTIETSPSLESLNVAIAGSILLHEIYARTKKESS